MGKFLKFIPMWLMVASWVCATLCGTSIAQKSDTAAVKARLEEVAKSYTKDNAFMGSVLVARGDQALLDRGYGMADVEWGIPDAPDVKFRLGSLTKQFTAVLVLLLQQDNKLRIEEPVSKYLPDLPKSWENITLAELLGHTSGIPDFTGDKDFGSWRMSPHTTTEKIAFFRDKPLDFEPGIKFQYSNSNYEVLGAVIERVSGKSYGDLLHERIFQPLEMNDSGLDICTRKGWGAEAAHAFPQKRSGVQTAPMTKVRLESITTAIEFLQEVSNAGTRFDIASYSCGASLKPCDLVDEGPGYRGRAVVKHHEVSFGGKARRNGRPEAAGDSGH